MAAGGYPGSYEKGTAISGIEAAGAHEGVEVFHAGTTRDGDGTWRTAGGRVLGVTAGADTVETAVRRAYTAVENIHWDGVHYRRDIAHRALSRQ
jgi:phosphoribosylamine--glycine ligase